VGLVPFLLSFWLIGRAHLTSGGSSGLGPWLRSQFAAGGLLSFNVLTDWKAPLHGAFATLVWTDWKEVEYALPSTALAPIMGVALAVLVFPRLRPSLPKFFVAFSVVYPALVLLMMGRQFVNIGGGVDLRYGLTFWPPFAILAAPAVSLALDRCGRAAAAHDVLFGAFGVLLLTIGVDLGVHAAHHNVTNHGIFFDQTAVIRFGGLALALLLLVGWLAQRSKVPVGHTTLIAVGAAVGTQILLLIIERGYGPWAAWPLIDVNRFLRFILFRHWPQYGI
jgi:hypothetical protein